MNKMPEYRVKLVRELRQRQTESEQLLWECLRGRKISGMKFRRQRPLGRYIADFCCDEAKLVVEIDGGIHSEAEQIEYDAIRDEALFALGYRIVRLTVEDVISHIDQYIETD